LEETTCKINWKTKMIRESENYPVSAILLWLSQKQKIREIVCRKRIWFLTGNPDLPLSFKRGRDLG
jgi:hypothetical protein